MHGMSGGEKSCCSNVNTHPLGFTILVFILAMLWLRVNGRPVFPLGFILALTVAYWHADIERGIYGRSRFLEMVITAVVGMIIGMML